MSKCVFNKFPDDLINLWLDYLSITDLHNLSKSFNNKNQLILNKLVRKSKYKILKLFIQLINSRILYLYIKIEYSKTDKIPWLESIIDYFDNNPYKNYSIYTCQNCFKFIKGIINFKKTNERLIPLCGHCKNN